MTPHHVINANAAVLAQWLTERGGIAIWDSINLANPGASWTTPALTKEGTPTPKPNWQVGNTPARIITDPTEVVVDVPREVRRFHVALRHGSQGMLVKLTDTSTRKVRAAVAAAGHDAWYDFDYTTQEAVIYVAESTVDLRAYLQAPAQLH